ncbi:hypothetical protein SH591_06175 [Sphingomonas sp. LY54]|uniref:hypothetical protein n=1 Tax=Sphingomonas sp. LY54 TaxID=3095343 RepID=UPI002D78EADD|nr:hypothetical protein [Sphingomonas sp. LY54]WRP29766.1 hypothetical protein SH591_06175 [Sphingomonas sp. LY54]
MADLPAIIEAGSKSPLAVLALSICILAILALSFFREASERTRVIIFLVILLNFAGALGIAYADWRNRPAREAGEHEPTVARSGPAPTILPPKSSDDQEDRGVPADPQSDPPQTQRQSSTSTPSPHPQESRNGEAYSAAEQRVMREARLSGSMQTIESSVRPGEWNEIDTLSDYDPQRCDTTALNVRLANRPLHGEFRTELTTTTYEVDGECRMVSGPATVIYYRPKSGYWGKDIFSYIAPALDRTIVVRTKGEGAQ